MEQETSIQSNISTPIAIIIAGVIISGALLWSSGGSTSTTQVAAAPQAGIASVVDSRKVSAVGNPVIGNANAPLTIFYWYDYQCPFCKQHEESAMPQLVKDYVDTGKIKIVFKDFQFLGKDSQTLGQYSRTVWETVPSKFYQWHKAVYDNQGTENTGWATQDKILSITKSALTADETNKVFQLVKTKSVEYQKQMDADKAEGAADGVNGTPAMIIGKQLVSGAVPYAQIQAAVEVALRSK